MHYLIHQASHHYAKHYYDHLVQWTQLHHYLEKIIFHLLTVTKQHNNCWFYDHLVTLSQLDSAFYNLPQVFILFSSNPYFYNYSGTTTPTTSHRRKTRMLGRGVANKIQLSIENPKAKPMKT